MHKYSHNSRAIRILGIDPGLVATGWGAIEKINNTLHYINCGTIKVPRTQPLPQRLALLLCALQSVVAEHTPDQMAIEAVFLGKNIKSAFALGQAHAIAMLTIEQRPYAEYAPRMIKRAVSPSGAADKKQLQRMLAHILPESPLAKNNSHNTEQRLADDNTADEHAADALAVAVCHAFNSPKKPFAGNDSLVAI